MDLIKSIQKCWESIKSERVLSYIQKQNLSKDQLKVAVIIQKMIDAKAAGVIFTANPVTSDRDEIMIESVLGLGESLVQGLVTPDNFIVDKKTLEIKSKDLQKTNGQSVSAEDIKKLVRLGIKIEKKWGNPQDIEWAIDRKGKLWILQSRPITTLNY